MDFCYVWLQRLVGKESEGFDRQSTRAADELTGNATEGRGLEHFTDGLSAVYRNMARALRPGAPLAFTYHHNKLEAYEAIGVAILDAGLTCTASIPCPAEMGSSIHIHGTGSSIIDTVFVCRSNPQTLMQPVRTTPAALLRLVLSDLDQLRSGGVNPTAGDIRCITYGHATRIAIWTLRATWNATRPTTEKLALFAERLSAFGDFADVIERAHTTPARERHDSRKRVVRNSQSPGRRRHAVSV